MPAGRLNRMPNPTQLIRLFNEIVFVLLGIFILVAGLSDRYILPHRSAWWILAGVALLYWSFRIWMQSARERPRWLSVVRACSLGLFGAIVISTNWLPQSQGTLLLAAGGGVLALRGLIGAVAFSRVP
jgi:drug/metabolite transporter superfamily protein YnfA